MTEQTTIAVKKYISKDKSMVYELCALTGNNGNPIDSHRMSEFSEVWVGSYVKFWPDWIYLLKDKNRVFGYLTGCPYSSAHVVLKKIHTLSLLPKIFKKQLHINEDLKRYLKRNWNFEKGPEAAFSKHTRMKLENEYPAHLHINLSEAIRGHGLGKRLLDAFEKDLRKINQSGIHVFCGKGPLEFYKKNHFKILEHVRFKDKFDVFCLGKKL